MTTIEDTTGEPLSAIDAPVVAAAVLLRLERAWNHADGAAYGNEFSRNTEFVDIRGAHHHGRTAVADGHQQLLDTIYAGSTISYQLETATLLTPDLIVILATATLEAPAGPLRGVSRARITAILGCTNGSWQITNFHNTMIQSADGSR